MKNIIKNYTEYLKDNPNGYWFKRKLYGWGWTPAKWQGWVIIAIFVVSIFWSATDMATVIKPTSNTIRWFLIRVIVSIIMLLVICFKKGESPKWQWGEEKK